MREENSYWSLVELLEGVKGIVIFYFGKGVWEGIAL